ATATRCPGFSLLYLGDKNRGPRGPKPRPTAQFRSLSPLKNRSLLSQSFCAQFFCGLLLAMVTIGLTSCGVRYYKFPTYTFANRPVPPSKLDSRVMVGLTINGSQGALQI